MDLFWCVLVLVPLILAIIFCPEGSEARATEKTEEKKNGGEEKRRRKKKRVHLDASPEKEVAGKVAGKEDSDEKAEKVGFLESPLTGESAPEMVESRNVGLQAKDDVPDESCAVRECGDEAGILEGRREVFEREVTNCVDSSSGESSNAAGAPDNGGNGVIDDDDGEEEWEGVESSELEKAFAEAVNYVEYVWKGKDSDLRFYGLHKLAVEGPCHAPQPMALMITARAKWNAWNRLGSMSPEDAMGEYIKVLTDADPGWKQHFTAESDSHASLQTAEDGHTAS